MSNIETAREKLPTVTEFLSGLVESVKDNEPVKHIGEGFPTLLAAAGSLGIWSEIQPIRSAQSRTQENGREWIRFAPAMNPIIIAGWADIGPQSPICEELTCCAGTWGARI